MLRSELRDAIARMQADLSHRWTMAELSNLAHLSPSQVGRILSDQLGVPPMALLAHLRVREMPRLLRDSDMTVGQIGVRMGWRDHGHAAEQFAKLMGVTPARIGRSTATGLSRRQTT